MLNLWFSEASLSTRALEQLLCCSDSSAARWLCFGKWWMGVGSSWCLECPCYPRSSASCLPATSALCGPAGGPVGTIQPVTNRCGSVVKSGATWLKRSTSCSFRMLHLIKDRQGEGEESRDIPEAPHHLWARGKTLDRLKLKRAAERLLCAPNGVSCVQVGGLVESGTASSWSRWSGQWVCRARGRQGSALHSRPELHPLLDAKGVPSPAPTQLYQGRPSVSSPRLQKSGEKKKYGGSF